MKPKHVRAIQYLNEGLFKDLSSFRELEDRIGVIDTPQGRGDAFEVFAEAYFATQRIALATEIWPWSSVPDRKNEIASFSINPLMTTSFVRLETLQLI